MKKKSENIVRLLSLALLAAVFLAGCSSGGNSGTGDSSSESVTVEFWHAYGEGEEKVLLEEVIPKFNETHPNIVINATRMPLENLEQQVITAAVGGAAPDVMRMDIIWVPRMAKEGVLRSVEGFEGLDQIIADSFEGPMSTNLYDGKYYGVPLDTNTKIAIYNKELLAEAGASEPPRTIDELVKLARVMKEQGKYGITIGGTDAWNMPPWFWTLGGRITDDNYTAADGYLNSEASLQALETIISWHDEGLLAPPILGGQPGTWEGLTGDEGNPPIYMMIEDGPWFFSLKGEEAEEKTIPAVMPAGPDGKSHSVVGGSNMVIFDAAKQPEAAWTFTRFMLSAEIQELMALKTGLIPANITAANSEQLKEVYYFDEYVAQLETALARTPHFNWKEIETVFQTAFESAIRKEASPKEALDQAAAEIDQLLKE